MKGSNKYFKQSLRTMGVSAVVGVANLSTLGSGSGGGGDDNGGGTPSNIKAFNFDAKITVNAAQLATTAMSFFPDFTTMSQGF